MKHKIKLALISTALVSIIGCTHSGETTVAEKQVAEPVVEKQAAMLIDTVLDAQADEAKARYQYRNPKETLAFFGIEPGMSVGEALPGGGWYSKILLPYLGSTGSLMGIDYPIDIWPNFSFVDGEFLEKRKNWTETWTADAQEWGGENGANVSAATFSTIPDTAAGSLDAVLFIRALHNMARYQDKGEYLTNALAATYDMLKPGGFVGIVQHAAREDRSDEFASGNNGYLKQSFVIAQMEAAGFEFVAASDINANEKDQADEGDIVWRLPPSFATSKDNEELKNAMMEIGESNRMTLKFRKPAA